MTDSANETIMNMVKNLKASVKTEDNFQFSTPVKRSLSSSNSNESFDGLSPAKKLKSDSKLDISYVGSPREIRRLRADLIEARNTILILENRISHMHNVRKQMQIMFDNETQTLKRQQEYDRKSIDELENQLQAIRKRENGLKSELTELKNNLSTLKLKSDEKLSDLEKSLNDIQEENKHKEIMEGSEISSLKRKINELQTVLQAAEGDAEAQKKLSFELEKKLSAKIEIEKQFEVANQALQKAKLHIKELEYAKENFLEFQEQAKSQAHKLANYIALEKEVEKYKEENVRLKDEICNKLLLEEEVFDLKTRLAKYKEQEKKLSELQAQQVQNEMHLNEWRAVARGICETTDLDSALPHLLRSVVEKLQQQEINLTAEKVDLDSQYKTAVHECKVAKAELEKNQKLLASLKATGEQKQNLIHRMQKKLLLISRERDSYRSQLDSYERDLTMCNNTTNMGTTAANQLQSQKERIENLERIVDGYRDMVAKLENDLQTAQPAAYTDNISVKAEQVKKLQDEIDHLKFENERLRERKDTLEIQLESQLVGHDTLQGGQVFHLANNPLAECLAQRENLVERLEQEVEKLKRKIKNMEEGIESSKLGDLSVCPQEVQNLKEQIKSHESQTQKLKDYFKSSMQEFRNIIYILLGYKIDRSGTSLYKLRSVYAEHEEDMLCFQVNNEGDLNLLENDYSATLEDMINLHLRHQKSFPVFLSAITMDLFNNKTRTFTS